MPDTSVISATVNRPAIFLSSPSTAMLRPGASRDPAALFFPRTSGPRSSAPSSSWTTSRSLRKTTSKTSSEPSNPTSTPRFGLFRRHRPGTGGRQGLRRRDLHRRRPEDPLHIRSHPESGGGPATGGRTWRPLIPGLPAVRMGPFLSSVSVRWEISFTPCRPLRPCESPFPVRASPGWSRRLEKTSSISFRGSMRLLSPARKAGCGGCATGTGRRSIFRDC
jgi:hypothetical protein